MGEHKLERTKSHGWRERELPALASDGLRATRTRLFDKGACQVLLSQEPRPGRDDRLWLHMSISRPDRYPTWDEIKDARYSLLPMGLTFAQILPPMNEYTNIHPNCFHLWEIEWHGT